MASTNCTYQKVLPVTTLVFQHFFSERISCNELIESTEEPNSPVGTFLSTGNLFDGAFLL